MLMPELWNSAVALFDQNMRVDLSQAPNAIMVQRQATEIPTVVGYPFELHQRKTQRNFCSNFTVPPTRERLARRASVC
jgi:hypothetical protein